MINMAQKTVLQVTNLIKSYGANRVLQGLSFELQSGEILGIVGENGAGKSTLVKCISRQLRSDSGEITPHDGRVAVIPQEISLIPELTVAENIFLGREICQASILRTTEMTKRSSDCLHRLGSAINPNTPAGRLTTSERQIVEIARALDIDANILILDEPTASLNPDEADRLFAVMQELKKNGYAMIYISHRLDEVLSICDRVAVLRDGVIIQNEAASSCNARQLASAMAGRELSCRYPDKGNFLGKTLLRATDISGAGVKNLSFELKAGEILGIAGLSGCGSLELGQMLSGFLKIRSGKLEQKNVDISNFSPRQSVKCGMGYLTGDRLESGVLRDFSIEENVTFAALDRYCTIGFISGKSTAKAADKYIEDFAIKCRSRKTPVGELSGGNQQKTAIAKMWDTCPEVMILNEPTSGVDVASRHQIYEFIRKAANAGKGIIVISSDQEELTGICDRILVMRTGKMAGVLTNESISEEEIMYLATGVK